MNTLKRKQIPKSDEDVEQFQVLYTDITFIEGCPIIAAIDKCSRYAIISVLKKATSSAINDFFISKIFNVFRLPVRIHSDAGKNFQGSCFKEMCNGMKIEHTMAIVGEHCSNQIIERFFRTLKLAINKQALEDKTTWRTTLEKVVFNYNNSPFSNHEVCPADNVFGFKVITLQMKLLNSTPSVQTEAKGYMQSIDQLKNLPKEVIVKVKDQNIKSTPAKILSNRNMLVSSTDDKRTDKIISLYKYRDAMIQNSNLSQL
uniref:Integrase catalytic domain-containing protein n=1 Tax=Strongyloides papillosus TaxID=174720 RepID=A0A0N5BYS0_STREA